MSYNRTEHKSITYLPRMLRRMYRTRFAQETAIYPSKVFRKPVISYKEGHSTKHQGYVLKVVCFRPTTPAVFKEAMEEVRSQLY